MSSVMKIKLSSLSSSVMNLSSLMKFDRKVTSHS